MEQLASSGKETINNQINNQSNINDVSFSKSNSFFFKESIILFF